jgi:integrase
MGLYKRGSVWWMSFSCEGKFIRRSAETMDRKLAQRIYDKIKGQIAEGKWFEKPPEEKTFGEMMDRYLLEHVSRKKSKRSYEGYVRNLKSYFKDYKLSEITTDLIIKYKEKRLKEGVKPATLNRDLAILKNAFNRAMYKWEPAWAMVNPMKKVDMETENNERDRWMNNEEWNNLQKSLPRWMKEIILLDIQTGLRQGEIIALRWPMLDLSRRVLTIPRPNTKNNEPKTVPLNDIAMEILKSRPRSLQTDLVFFTRNHTQYRADNVRREFRKALMKSGIIDFRFHDLRHTFASRCLHSGADLYQVQKLLGHKTGAVTQRYAHHCVDSLRSAVDDLAKNFDTKNSANVQKTVNQANV